MMTLPLAIYTADHGLAWTYPKQEIGFAELDACRTALAPLPDFDLGEVGYEGVWVTDERVFVIVCQSVANWDFRGRNATYLAVTWLSREEAKQVDFDALIRSEALQIPTKTPSSFFQFQSRVRPSGRLNDLPQTLSDGFQSVNALVETLEPSQMAKLKCTRGAVAVTCRYGVASAPTQSAMLSQDFLTSHLQDSSSVEAAAQPMAQSLVQPSATPSVSPWVPVLASLLGLSVALNVFLGYAYLKQHPELKSTILEKVSLQQPTADEPQPPVEEVEAEEVKVEAEKPAEETQLPVVTVKAETPIVVETIEDVNPSPMPVVSSNDVECVILEVTTERVTIEHGIVTPQVEPHQLREVRQIERRLQSKKKHELIILDQQHLRKDVNHE